MKFARVKGKVTLSLRDSQLVAGSLLICETFDAQGLACQDQANKAERSDPMAQSLIVLDRLGAREGDTIAYTESGEATAPFYPLEVPTSATSTAIIDNVQTEITS